jgi:hypothetical protein
MNITEKEKKEERNETFKSLYENSKNTSIQEFLENIKKLDEYKTFEMIRSDINWDNSSHFDREYEEQKIRLVRNYTQDEIEDAECISSALERVISRAIRAYNNDLEYDESDYKKEIELFGDSGSDCVKHIVSLPMDEFEQYVSYPEKIKERYDATNYKECFTYAFPYSDDFEIANSPENYLKSQVANVREMLEEDSEYIDADSMDKADVEDILSCWGEGKVCESFTDDELKELGHLFLNINNEAKAHFKKPTEAIYGKLPHNSYYKVEFTKDEITKIEITGKKGKDSLNLLENPSQLEGFCKFMAKEGSEQMTEKQQEKFFSAVKKQGLVKIEQGITR